MRDAEQGIQDVNAAIVRAIELVREAIEHLDEAGAPSDIAAHLDLAMNRMKDVANGKRVRRYGSIATESAK